MPTDDTTPLDFWRRALAGLQPLDLPLDFPRPPVFSHRAGRHRRRLAAPAVARLRRLGGGQELTASLLAAAAATLHRLTGQERIAIGTPAAGDTLVLHLPVDAGQGFAALAAAAAAVVRDAYAHPGIPFERLADLLDPGHDPSRHPLCQVLLALGEPARPDFATLDLAFHFTEQRSAGPAVREASSERRQSDPGEEKGEGPSPSPEAAPILGSPPSPSAERGAGGRGPEPVAEAGLPQPETEVEITLVYAADLFAATTIERLAEAFCALAEAAAADPARPIARLPLLPAAEERRIRAGHGSSPLEFPQERLLHETFFLQAVATPQKIALRAGAHEMTFAAAAALAGRVAWALRRAGAGPEARVGVFLERDHRLVATLIGVLTADAAYVPLDPEYPAERIGFTLDDAEARLIVTQRSLRDRLPPTAAEILLIEDLAAAEDLPESPPPRLGSQLNLAYLIYTSGSTGRPKGVAIAHRSAVAFLEWTRHVFSEREMACVLFSTSICFDISIFEMFATLQRGGTVVVVKNAFELPHLACRDQLTLIDTVPSVTRELLRDGHLPPQVETVNLAGEALPQDLVDRCWQEPGVRRVYNFYGPSEDTTFSTYEMCRPGLPPTIGRLIEGSRGFVTDRHLELLPLGFPGELHLAGEGLSRGYLGRPRLTAERYLPDPFSGIPGGRMYRSGDLIRHREDGGFHFCGRLDHQVKVRGFRVELGEIEIALRDHPAVAQAVVTARADGPGGQRLVSYVVPRPGEELDGETLRAFLARRLPPFMVPAATVVLGAFPLTPNGKVDRKMLPPPEATGADRKAYRPPETAAETALAAIWGELLQRGEIGLDDDFFVLGGDSILVIQVVSRAYAAGWDLEPRELFLHTTLAGAAAAARPVEKEDRDAEESQLGQDELADVLADLDGAW